MAIPFVRQMRFDYGVPDRLSPRITRVVSANPGPFTFLGTGVYIVGGPEGCAVIDPGPDIPGQMEMLVTALAGAKVSAILVTHHHLDHSPMARPLAALTGAPLYGTPAPVQHTAPIGPELEEGEDDGFRPDHILADGEAIRGPDWTLRAMATPGHTSAHLCFHLMEDNALFSGDHVMGWSTTVISPPDGNMAAYFASLDKVRALAPAVIYPTHGPPIDQPGPFIDALIAHRRAREQQVLAQLAKGPQTIAEMVPEVYATTERTLWPAAAHSMLAHLFHLVQQGAVEADGGAGPSAGARYRLAM